ncbi:hypothetical protein Q0F99_10955 [Rathayibacter oskolensis]|uniref:hypothetical protein n=1 Tax=Rathayibacter oskolensis TaxID=1891671 RepID=UPI00265F36BD|nr:hypothetical protein [Rathayibacter oskolensis]WKK70400.1 hypothetical protein Q0F99_10955 [Rathayibacter oskolensis]
MSSAVSEELSPKTLAATARNRVPVSVRVGGWYREPVAPAMSSKGEPAPADRCHRSEVRGPSAISTERAAGASP